MTNNSNSFLANQLRQIDRGLAESVVDPRVAVQQEQARQYQQGVNQYKQMLGKGVTQEQMVYNPNFNYNHDLYKTAVNQLQQEDAANRAAQDAYLAQQARNYPEMYERR